MRALRVNPHPLLRVTGACDPFVPLWFDSPYRGAPG
jgi:hypothetical protein